MSRHDCRRSMCRGGVSETGRLLSHAVSSSRPVCVIHVPAQRPFKHATLLWMQSRVMRVSLLDLPHTRHKSSRQACEAVCRKQCMQDHIT